VISVSDPVVLDQHSIGSSVPAYGFVSYGTGSSNADSDLVKCIITGTG
jgi:hypothetical protein